jgi:putative transcriptional regulator
MGNKDNDIQNLAGKILLATPSISNEYLDKSMVYLCSHDDRGAMGIVINKRVPDMNVCSILKKLRINPKGIANLDIHFGGLEEIDKCFILHSDDYSFTSSISVGCHLALTINGDIIKVITSPGGGPEKKLLCMGCCIWEAEELENEVASSHWIPIDPDEALIFGDSKTDKWSKALLKIGSQTNVFSDLQGNA